MKMLAPRPFERPPPRGLLVGLRTPALARQDVGNHVVAKGRILRRRREFQSFARELHGFVEPLFLIEVRLGEEQGTLRRNPGAVGCAPSRDDPTAARAPAP